MFLLNFVPSDSKTDNYQFLFSEVKSPRVEIYFKTVHILYSKTSQKAKICCDGMQVREIPFASS
jgi:hypothetical protein